MNISLAISKVNDSLNEVESLIDAEEEGIDLNACENHRDFCKELLELLES